MGHLTALFKRPPVGLIRGQRGLQHANGLRRQQPVSGDYQARSRARGVYPAGYRTRTETQTGSGQNGKGQIAPGRGRRREIEMKSYMYKQGEGYIVCHWDEQVHCYRCSGEMPYFAARAAVGSANCPHATDGQCDKPTHFHL